MGTKTRMKVGWKRLLRLAKLLEVADERHRAKNEPAYKQHLLVHNCGSPGCAIGHYAAANKARGWAIKRDKTYREMRVVIKRKGLLGICDPRVQKEFAISAAEASELFSATGCDGAPTASAAAAYIRMFVGRKTKSAV